jgi:hypothetical protein
MLFKVSFKETDKNPSRVVNKYGRKTVVVLKGSVRLPEFWKHVPEGITDWISCQESVEIYENMAENTLVIFSEGKSKCHADDRYDSILGERIAEARAKYRMYHFFYKLISRLYDYYNTLLFGEVGVVDSGSGNCLMQDAVKYDEMCKKEMSHIVELLNGNHNGKGK